MNFKTQLLQFMFINIQKYLQDLFFEICKTVDYEKIEFYKFVLCFY